MPVHAHRWPRLAHSGAAACFLHQFPHLHVVDHFHRQPPVRSHFFVHAAANQLERANSDIRSGFRIAHAPRPGREHERASKERHHHFFAEGEQFCVGQQRQMIPLVFLSQRNRPAQQVGSEVHVGIREDQPFPARIFVSALQGVGFTEPAGGKGIDPQHFQARIALRGCPQNCVGRIRGTVVHRHDFVARIIQRQKGR